MTTSARASALASLRQILDVPADDAPTQDAQPRRTSSQRASGREAMPLSPAMAHRLIRRGVPSRSLEPLGRYFGLGKGALAEALDLDRVTAQRKVARDEPLPTHAAESMLRLLELDRLAQETFASADEAAEWLRRAHPMLDGQTPLACAKSAFGAQRAKDILVALKYGGAV